ncbi:MAG: hypothetical protein A2849_01330 [Candidatus Taylorbacteria bacterium RIFCSPHIGHO2_01_FULL_51_15]|uniref:DUF4258 domain-containing protein n=1 Tax=Candidatus Taylorbacteria bacterium RIFCSPHIGHO2_01_FULL_51_15 TaxID=1802304 RepID=A0A1G2MBL0_9BACT|nr:MAG: hypothetical protein A2849_01330 [Candidatus Taylorbacteria bacterium RIFCSPHIGHO2_01_FULL_51_15]
MKFRFTHHAEYRVFIERNISAEAIKETIRTPDTVTALPDGVIKCSKKLEAGMLTVVYCKDKNTYIIITAYFK